MVKRIHFADNFWLQIHNYTLHMYIVHEAIFSFHAI